MDYKKAVTKLNKIKYKTVTPTDNRKYNFNDERTAEWHLRKKFNFPKYPFNIDQVFTVGSALKDSYFNLCKVNESDINGKGLFAICDIPANIVITLMPAHLVRLDNNIYKNMDKCDKRSNIGLHGDDDDDDDYMQIKNLSQDIKYSTINKQSKINSFFKSTHDTSDDSTNIKLPKSSYIKRLFDLYAISYDKFDICGDPQNVSNSNYLGHMANDGIGPFKNLPSLDNMNFIDMENYIRKAKLQYIKKVKKNKLVNAELCSWSTLPGCFIASTRYIKAGEEILVSYGPDYWLWQHFKIYYDKFNL